MGSESSPISTSILPSRTPGTTRGLHTFFIASSFPNSVKGTDSSVVFVTFWVFGSSAGIGFLKHYGILAFAIVDTVVGDDLDSLVICDESASHLIDRDDIAGPSSLVAFNLRSCLWSFLGNSFANVIAVEEVAFVT
jgi:hypothetical protein